MNPDMRVDALLERLLAESPASRAPDQLRRAIASETGRRRQRPRWLAILKEPPMRYRSHVAVGSPTARVAALAAVTLLTAVLATGALVGAQTPSPAPPEEGPNTRAAAWVTGTCPYSGTQVGRPTVTMEDGVTTSYGLHWEGFRACDLSDPRLIGTGALMANTHTYAVEGDDPIIVMSQTYRIENEAGTWEGVGGPGLARGPGAGLDTVTDTAVYVGRGAYEGLTAYLVFDFSQDPVTVVGAIFPGELPPTPALE